MPSPLVIVIVVATSDAHSPATIAMTAATRAELVDRALVVTHEIEQWPTDAAADDLARALHADALVEVQWREDHRRVHIRLERVGERTWLERDVDFAENDAEEDRGKNLALKITSMLPTQRSPERPAAAPDRGLRRWGVDASLVGAFGVGGIGGGLGFDAGARWYPASWFAFHSGVGARFGELSDPTISTTTLRGRVGMALEVFRTRDAMPLAGILRFDGLLLHHSIDRAGRRPAGAGRWLGAVDILGEGAWTLGIPLELTAALGAEVAFGRTEIAVDDAVVAVIPRLRMIGEVGLRARF